MVAGETHVATIEPRDPDLLDARSIAQAEARVNAAEAAVQKMIPLLEEAQATKELAEKELQRVREASRSRPQAVTESELDSKLMAFRTSSAMLRAASHDDEIARFELEQARAALTLSQGLKNRRGHPPVVVGTLLLPPPSQVVCCVVFQESSAVVTAGTPLLELGDPRDLEVEIDVLSRDAVKVPAGARVLLEHWGGDKVLQGQVRLVEPSAFTKISTLGVEEQRVNVIVDLLDPPHGSPLAGRWFPRGGPDYRGGGQRRVEGSHKCSVSQWGRLGRVCC